MASEYWTEIQMNLGFWYLDPHCNFPRAGTKILPSVTTQISLVELLHLSGHFSFCSTSLDHLAKKLIYVRKRDSLPGLLT